MADNFNVKDAAGSTITIAARDTAGVKTPKSYVADGDNLALGGMADAAASSDAGTFSLIGLVKRLLGRFTVGAASLVKAEDAAHVSGDAGVMMLGVRADTPAATAGTTGDYQPLISSSTGRVWGSVLIDTALPAGEAFVGQAGMAGDVIELTPTLDTSKYADGDVLFDTTALAAAFRVSGGRCEVVSITALDKDDQGVAMDIVFLRANSPLGTFNIAPAINDTQAEDVLGIVSIAAGDWIDLGANRVATKTNLCLMLEPTTGTTLYVAGITRGGTPTYTASGLKLKFGLRWP